MVRTRAEQRTEGGKLIEEMLCGFKGGVETILWETRRFVQMTG